MLWFHAPHPIRCGVDRYFQGESAAAMNIANNADMICHATLHDESAQEQEQAGKTLVELYGDHHDVLWDEGFHKYSVELFIRDLDQLLGSTRLVDFPQEKLDFLISSLRKRGNSNATINRKMSALSKLLKKAHRMGEVHSLPEFRRLKERAGRIRFLELDEEDRLFAAIRARSHDYYRLSVFLVDTGARLGEAIGMRWNDIHAERVTFWITKSGRSRTLPLTQRAQQVLCSAKPAKGGPFMHITQQNFRVVWHEAKQECGLGDDADIVPHILRHTCASRLVRGGIDLRRVQTWLGHQTLQMTMRYAHLATHDLDACVPVLEQREKENA